MFIIDKEGKLAYAGGIDNKPNDNPEAPLADGTTNYVDKALSELEAGRRRFDAGDQVVWVWREVLIC